MQRPGVRGAILIACLAVAAIAAVIETRPPGPRPQTAPATRFSASRAMRDDRVIARVPHPEGSAAARVSRDYIFDRMNALRLNPRRLEGQAVESLPRYKGLYAAGGQVEDLLGVLPGGDAEEAAILLMAHSDSVPGSPGAADDAAGVAACLEVVRALEAAGSRRRPVIVLFTDGEEVGLLGARAFFQSRDPLLKTIGLVINLEARGGGGRVAMFETGPRNGGRMAFFARHVGDTDALSLMSEVYKYMPNSTDFTVAERAGLAGYNFAFVGQQFDYHSPSSTAEVLDQGSLQHLGDQVLATAAALAAAPTLPPPRPDAVYADVLGGPVISYSAAVQACLLAAAAALAGVGVVRGARRSGETLSLSSALKGAAAALSSLFAAALALHLANRALGGDLIRYRGLMAEIPLLFAGMAALTAAAALGVWTAAFGGRSRLVYAGLILAATAATLLLPGPDLFGLALGGLSLIGIGAAGRPATPWSGWLGVLTTLFLVTSALQALAPPLTVAVAWPLFLGALTAFVAGLGAQGDFGETPAVFAAALAGLLCAAGLGHLATTLFISVGLDAPEALAVLPLAAAPALFPLLDCLRRRRIAGVVTALLGAGGIGLLTAAAVQDPWSVRRPEPVQAIYVDDADAGAAWRVDSLPRLDPWSKQALGAGGPISRVSMEPYFDAVYRAPARAVALQRPQFVSTIAVSGRGRTVTVRITPQAGGRELRLFLQPTEALGNLTINGRPSGLSPRPGVWARLRWADPAAPLVLTFEAGAGGSLDLRYGEIIDGWPQGETEPVKGVRRMPWGLSDTTLLTDRTSLRW